MSRRENCHDNAVAKAFSNCSSERIRRKIYNSREEARPDVFGHTEMSYSPKRRHGYNNLRSPVDYEKQDFKRLASVHDTGAIQAAAECTMERYSENMDFDSLAHLGKRTNGRADDTRPAACMNWIIDAALN